MISEFIVIGLDLNTTGYGITEFHYEMEESPLLILSLFDSPFTALSIEMKHKGSMNKEDRF